VDGESGVLIQAEARNLSVFEIVHTDFQAHPNAYSKITAGIFKKVKRLGHASPQKFARI
jgi:hypothetical protein